METQSPTPTTSPAPSTPATTSPPSDSNSSLDTIFNFDTLDSELATETTPADAVPEDQQFEQPPEEAPPVEETPETPPEDEAPPVEEEPAPEPSPEEPKPLEVTPTEGDVDPELKPYLKQMSKQASAAVMKRLAAVKADAERATAERDGLNEKLLQFEGKKLPDSWYNDPNAFQAVPQYQEAATKFAEAQKETDKWTELSDAYESGEVKFDGQKFVPNDPDNPSPINPRIKRQLQDNRIAAYEAAKEHASKANEIRNNFSSQYKAAADQITGQTEKLFPFVKDDKAGLHQPYQRILKQIPPQFREHPSSHLASALGVTVLTMKAELETLRAQVKAKSGVAVDKLKAGPIPGRPKASLSSVLDQKYTDKDLEGL
jgi:hypothetical protein